MSMMVKTQRPRFALTEVTDRGRGNKVYGPKKERHLLLIAAQAGKPSLWLYRNYFSTCTSPTKKNIVFRGVTVGVVASDSLLAAANSLEAGLVVAESSGLPAAASNVETA